MFACGIAFANRGRDHDTASGVHFSQLLARRSGCDLALSTEESYVAPVEAAHVEIFLLPYQLGLAQPGVFQRRDCVKEGLKIVVVRSGTHRSEALTGR